MSEDIYEGLTEEEAMEFRARAEWEEEHDQAQAASMPEPSTLEVAANAAAKGAAGFADMFLNAPVNAYNLAKAGAVAFGDVTELPQIRENLEITPQPNLAQKALSAVGAISEAREPQTSMQRIVDVATQTGVGMLGTPLKAAGVLPKVIEAGKNVLLGITSGTAAQATKEATGSDLAATAVGIGTTLVGGSIGSRANAPTLANPIKTATLKDAQAAGYKMVPSDVKPSFTTNRLESFAGKAATKQKVAIENQGVTNRLAAEDIGLPGETVLNEATLMQVRDQAGQVYRDIAAVSPRAASALEGLKQARFDAKEQWNYYARSGNPEAGQQARALSARAEQYERIIEREAKTIIKTYGLKPGPAGQTVQGTIVRPLGLPGATAPGQAGLPPGMPQPPGIETREVGFATPDLAGQSAKSKSVGFATPSTEQVPPVSRDVGFAVPGSPRQGPSQAGQQPRGWTQTNAPPPLQLVELGQRLAGRPTLLQELRDARTRIAKTHDIEKALNLGTGDVDAHIIGQLLDKGGLASKSGNLRIIGKFAQAARSATREGPLVPAPGVSALDAATILGLGTAGYLGTGDPRGLALGAIPLLRGPARAMLLSKGYQNRLLKEPPALNQAMLKSVLAGRSIAESER